jgi:hypothetical protein
MPGLLYHGIRIPGMQIPFIGDIEDDSTTNQEETPAGHATAQIQRGYHFLLLNPMQSFSGILQPQGPGKLVTTDSRGRKKSFTVYSICEAIANVLNNDFPTTNTI